MKMEFEEVYRTYFRDVYLYLRRLSGDELVAEEVTSETFFRAMRSIEKFRGECDLRVWLCQIAKNCYYTYVKKHAGVVTVDYEQLQAVADPKAGPEEGLTQREEAVRLQKLLHTLPEPYREVVMWRVYAELSFKQIGQVFGKSENWACVTYHRAKKMLRSRWEEDQHEK